MDIIKVCQDKVTGKKFRLVLPEGNDERIIRAARIIKDMDIAEPIVLGKPEKVEAAIAAAGVDISDIEVINSRQGEHLEAYGDKYAAGRDDINPAIARRLIAKPVFYAGMMVANGHADVLLAGLRLRLRRSYRLAF